MTRRLSLLALLALVSCGGNGPEALSIGEVVADPARYGDTTVELSGEVTDSMGILTVGVYTLTDSTGEITVLTSEGLPSKATQLTVRGAVLSGATIGGEHYGTSLREQERVYPE